MEETNAQRHKSPSNCQESQPVGSTELVDEGIAGNLENDVTNEEDHQNDGRTVVLFQAKVIIHARNASNRHIGSIDEGDSVKTAENGQQAPIDLAKNSLLVLGVLNRIMNIMTGRFDLIEILLGHAAVVLKRIGHC